MKLLLSLFLFLASLVWATPFISMTPKQMNTMGVTTGQLIKVDVASQGNLPATVITPPSNLFLATSMQDGVIEKTFVSLGDSVKAGQPLAVVSSLSGITLQREYLQLQNKFQRASLIAQKDQNLLHNGIISAREAMRSQQEAELLEADLQEKKTLLKMMGINVKNGAHQMGGKSVITAPTHGVIVEQSAILGQKIDAMTPLFKIANLSTLWIDIQTPLTTARLVKIGDSVRTSLGAYAQVIKIAKGVDAKNQSVTIRAKVVQGVEKLYPGQFIQAAISTPQSQGIIVPKSGLMRHNNESYIFVRTPKGFIVKKVHVVKEECTTFIISGDINGNEDVAISGIVALKGILSQHEAAK